MSVENKPEKTTSRRGNLLTVGLFIGGISLFGIGTAGVCSLNDESDRLGTQILTVRSQNPVGSTAETESLKTESLSRTHFAEIVYPLVGMAGAILIIGAGLKRINFF